MDDKTILVCVTVQKECERLILAGKRLADSGGLPLRVLHVAEPGDAPLSSPDAQEALNCLYALSRDNGATMTVLYSADVRLVHAVCVVVGSDRQQGWAMAEELEELLDDSVTIMRA